MKKALWIIIAIIIIGLALYTYVARPVSAPTEDVNQVSSKLPAGSATTSAYMISQSESKVTFTMNEMLRGKPFLVVGTTTQVAGRFDVKDGKLAMSNLRINARTLVTDSAQRNGAIARLILKSEKPENEFITFAPVSNEFAVLMGKPTTFDVAGNLTISGVTKPVTFKVTATVTDNKVVGKAETKIKRSDFGLVIPNLSFIANVDNEFPVTIDVVANRIME